VKRRFKILIITVMIMTVFIGAGSGFFVTTNPIIDLDSLLVDSPGINLGDVSIYDTDPNNDTDNPQMNDDPNSVQPEYEYTVRVRGKNIYFENKLLLSVDALMEEMNNMGINKTTKVHLVEDYADSAVYKSVREFLDEECSLTIDQWEYSNDN